VPALGTVLRGPDRVPFVIQKHARATLGASACPIGKTLACSAPHVSDEAGKTRRFADRRLVCLAPQLLRVEVLDARNLMIGEVTECARSLRLQFSAASEHGLDLRLGPQAFSVLFQHGPQELLHGTMLIGSSRHIEDPVDILGYPYENLLQVANRVFLLSWHASSVPH